MASLIKQMEQLQKQQAILAEKIKEDEERKKKVAQEASIERLEALIQPITEHLDWVRMRYPVSKYGQRALSDRDFLSLRQEINERWEHKKKEWNSRHDIETHNTAIKIEKYPILANEEIFVTLLSIIKKQDVRIQELEARLTVLG